MALSVKIRNVILSAIGVVTSTAAIGVWKFYHDWTVDEKIEESQQFDNAEQKVEVINHVRNSFSASELTKNRMMDSLMVKELLETLDDIKTTVKHADSMAQLNADQVYQIKEVIKKN